jgi:bacillithiol biosynthesis cysteine-adding enzyme BshC
LAEGIVSIEIPGESDQRSIAAEFHTILQPLTADVYMPTFQDIPFRSIPRQSALFLSYLDLSPAALRFYAHAPSLENLAKQSAVLSAGPPFPRSEMVSILRRQNESYACESQTLRHISDLEQPECVAVLTGQQVGLFGGPLYTIYKALTAVGIARRIRGMGIPAVAVFWMETEDHDLAEVTRRTVYDSSSSPEVMDYREILWAEKDFPPRPVGSIPFPGSISKAVEDYMGRLPDTLWKPGARFLLESSYKPGATFAQAFARLMARVLTGSGLILFDPQDAQAKRLASTVFRRALLEADAVRAALFQRNRELESAGFHPQAGVPENSTVLFLVDEGERHALERRGSGFGIKHGERRFSLEEMVRLAEQSPEKFSPNVFLRPLVQDYLFPTAAYVGGPSELAYFAQIEALYSHFGRPMPAIWPRNSFTLLGPEIVSWMDRFRIDIRDCFQGRESLMEKAVENSGFSRAVDHAEKLRRRLDEAFSEIRPGIEAIDPPLAQALDTARRKVLHNARRLKSRLARLEAAHGVSVPGGVDALLHTCFPNGNPQEREFSLHHFLVRHGPSILEVLRSATDVGNFNHRVIRLEESGAEARYGTRSAGGPFASLRE